jgi:hypothetical protein
MAQLTKEQMAAIDNYSSDIKTLKDFVTAVRKLPGMYIGSTNTRGFYNMFREIFQNSVDQILDQSSTANWVNVYVNCQTLEVRVEDNGKGLPFNDIIRMVMTPHTSKNFDKKPYEYIVPKRGQPGKAVGRDYAYRVIHEAGIHFGLDNLGTHTMRKTFGYHFYKKTKDVVLLMKIFNHTSESRTLRYIGIEQTAINEAMMKFNYDY